MAYQQWNHRQSYQVNDVCFSLRVKLLIMLNRMCVGYTRVKAITYAAMATGIWMPDATASFFFTRQSAYGN